MPDTRSLPHSMLLSVHVVYGLIIDLAGRICCTVSACALCTDSWGYEYDPRCYLVADQGALKAGRHYILYVDQDKYAGTVLFIIIWNPSVRVVFDCVSACLCVCLSVRLSACLPDCLFACLALCRFACRHNLRGWLTVRWVLQTEIAYSQYTGGDHSVNVHSRSVCIRSHDKQLPGITITGVYS